MGILANLSFMLNDSSRIDNTTSGYGRQRTDVRMMAYEAACSDGTSNPHTGERRNKGNQRQTQLLNSQTLLTSAFIVTGSGKSAIFLKIIYRQRRNYGMP